MLDTLSTHTNSYCKIQVSGSQLRFYDDPDFPAEGLCTWDPDCTGNGYYSYTVDGSGLNITMLKDFCPPRAPSFSGTWARQ